MSSGLDIAGVPNSGFIDSLFSSTSSSQAQFDSLANAALSRGIDHYQKGKYQLAIDAFKKSASLAPFTDNSAKAYNYIGLSYLKLGKIDEAINVYKAATRIYPVRDDFHLALGDIYAKQGDQVLALKEYEAAVRFNPDSVENRYSLGQSYLDAGRFDAARKQFQSVIRLAPNGATGYFGVGQVARAEGDLQEAVLQFKKAISVNRSFLNSYRDLGYAYADLGEFEKANEQVSILTGKNTTEATNLRDYIDQATAPKIDTIHMSSGFNTRLGPGTSVTELSSKLLAAGGKKLFSMDFVFSKEMDRTSVTNPYNWTISRASIQANGGVYNGGLSVPQTEAAISPTPLNIMFDDDANTATIQFLISQNAYSNATIDPKHIVFKFSGVDAYGMSMDTSADEYSGFRGIA